MAASRTLLRLVWFLDFVHALLDNLATMPEAELYDCALKAYEHALAHRHGFLVKNSIYVSLPCC